MNATEIPTDADLERLELYLDEALDPAEAAALRTRLAADAELSATLDELRSQRAGRAVVWAALEPDDRAVEQLCWRVRGAVAAELRPPGARPSRWRSFAPDPWHVARFASAAAACVMLGFFGGRLGRAPAPHPSVAAVDPAPIVDSAPLASGSPVEIPITNEYGQTVATQRFANAEQARRFLADLHQAHEASPSAPVEGQPRLASELHY